MIPRGGLDFEVNPLRYNLVESPTARVLVPSKANQSIVSSTGSIAFGGIICVIKAWSSFSNASFLNPSETNANCPKFELEFVIDASPPDCALKCLLYPIANTETIWSMALFVILTWADYHPDL